MKNPAYVVPILAYFGGVLTSAGIAYTTMRARGRVYETSEVVYFDDVPMVLFFRPTSVLSAAVAKFSGAPGKFSHVALYPALRNRDNEPLLLDADVGHGIVFRPLSYYEGRDVEVITLPPESRVYVQGAAIGAEGRPYKFRRGGDHCAEVVYRCLPPDLRERLQLAGDVTPNTLYRALTELAQSDEDMVVEELRAMVE